MIKIQATNLNNKKAIYLASVTPVVAFRVSVLKKSLSHLAGGVISFDEGDFDSFKPVTRKIMKLVGDAPADLNTRDGYTNAINTYRNNPNHLHLINSNGLFQLCQDLLANNNLHLSDLLICEPANLIQTNTALLNAHNLTTPYDVAVLKLAFSYEYDSVASPIKNFYRSNIFCKVCPYCNVKPVLHQTNAAGEVVESFELDHFYDKSRYPLLSYSLFNLVPSDHTCNKSNKGASEFTDQFHMNPHEMGYINSIRFFPVGLTPSYQVDLIDVEILEPPGTSLYQKINGRNRPDQEAGYEGNLNVFKIRYKHSSQSHRASKILTTVHNRNTYLKHQQRYLRSLTNADLKNAYKKWYKDQFDVSIDCNAFNDKEFSKLSRDIHDHYYLRNRTKWNKYVLELISEL